MLTEDDWTKEQHYKYWREKEKRDEITRRIKETKWRFVKRRARIQKRCKACII